MVSSLTRLFVAASTVVGGLLAGVNIDRNIVQMPAWHVAGIECWAAYSRNADLSLQGMILYISLGVGGAILSLAAAVSFMRDRRQFRANSKRVGVKSSQYSAAIPIYLAALFVLGGMLATTQAAPIMLSVRHLGNNPVLLQQAFDGFEFYSMIRGVFQVLAFGANVWALVAVYKGSSQNNG